MIHIPSARCITAIVRAGSFEHGIFFVAEGRASGAACAHITTTEKPRQRRGPASTSAVDSGNQGTDGSIRSRLRSVAEGRASGAACAYITTTEKPRQRRGPTSGITSERQFR